MMAKRIVALLLAIVLTLNMLPAVSAASEESREQTPAYSAAAMPPLTAAPRKHAGQVQKLQSASPAVEPTSLEGVSNARLESYEQYLSYYYLNFSALSYHLNNDELPYHTYVNNAGTAFKTMVDAWKVTTMDMSDLLTYSAKEVDFYLLLIYDVIYQKMHKKSDLNNFSTYADTIMADTLLELADTTAAGALELAPDLNITKDNWKEVMETIVNTKTCRELLGYLDTILQCVDYVGTLDELFRKIAMMKEFINCSDEIDALLAELHSSASNELLKEALRKMRLMCTGLLSESEIVMIFGGDIALGEVSAAALGALWTVVTKGNLIVPSLGQGVGKLASNALCGTDAIVENWYSMQKVYNFEQVLKGRVQSAYSNYTNTPSRANARKLNRAVDMYLNTMSVGMEYAIQYVEAVRDGGAMAWIYNFFQEKDYDSLLQSLERIKYSLDLSIELANNVPNNEYLAELEANKKISPGECEKTPCTTTEQEVDDTVAALPDINFQVSNHTCRADTTYAEDRLTYANFTLKNCNLDLAGHTLTVYGNFYMTGGTLNINGGKLIVLGGLYLEDGMISLNGGTVEIGGDAIFAQIKSDGSYTNTFGSGGLTMTNEADVFSVGGDLVTYLYTADKFICSAGIMRIGGDWTNYRAKLTGTGTFETFLTGTDDVTLYGYTPFYVPTLTIENAADRNISIRGTVTAGTLQGGDMTLTTVDTPSLRINDTTGALVIQGNILLSIYGNVGGSITVNGNAILEGLAMSGHPLTITGDVLIQSNLTIGSADCFGIMTVGGNFNIYAGMVHLNHGALNVAGDAIFAQIYSDGSYSNTAGSAGLTMTNEADVFSVGGDLVTYLYTADKFICSAGIMRIGGSWTNYRAKLTGTGTFETFLTGTDDVTLYGYTPFYVPTLTIENAADRNISIRGTVTAGTLQGGDMTLTTVDTPSLRINDTTGALVIQGNILLSIYGNVGGSITVNGNAILEGLAMSGHPLTVTGDVLLQSHLTIGSADCYGTMTVGGNFNIYAGMVHLNNGALNVAGDAIFAQINSNGSYGNTAGSAGLTMTSEADVFSVGGDLVTYLYTAEKFICSAGSVRVGGSWTNYRAKLTGKGTFETVLTGTDDVTLYGDSLFYVPTLTIENGADRNISIRGTVTAGTLQGEDVTLTAVAKPTLQLGSNGDNLAVRGDILLSITNKACANVTVSGALYSRGLVMGPNTLTVHGDLYLDTNNTLILGPSGALCVSGDVRMSAGELSLAGTTTISGNLYQSGGNVKPNGGSLTILGDYRIQSADESTGELLWTTSAGRLHMVNSSDQVIVGGSFHTASTLSHSGYLNAGTLYVCGDFHQYAGNANNFLADGTHTTVLCGTRPQTASFESAASRFNILRLTQDISQYTFVPNPCWVTLEENGQIPEEVKCLNGHTWDNGAVQTAPGCLTEGVMCYNCTVCGETKLETIPARGHSYTAFITEPGCLTRGYTTHTCGGCGESYVDSYTEALGHLWDDGIVTVEPTTEREGVRTYTCTHCGDSRTEPIPALEDSGHTHDYTSSVTAPTCDEQGYTTYTCSCGDSYTADYVTALGHTWDGGTVICYPSCVLDGTISYVCTACGAEKTESIPAYGHDYICEVIDPSCTEYGCILYTCAECGHSYRTELTDPLWHYYTDGSCKRCHAAEPETLASGVCGDSLSWILTSEAGSSDVVLTISGTGAMWDFDESVGDDPAPWNGLTLDRQITAILISDGCTAIGDCAFDGDTVSAETVILADSITKIGKHAFRGQAGLETLRLPESLKTLEEGAFRSTGLLDVVLPDSVAYLQTAVFADCSGLRRAVLSESLTAIADQAFRGCTALSDVHIPDSVTKIQSESFSHTALPRITLPDSVTRIGDRAFYGCEQAEGIVSIGKAVISIGAGAFAGCSSLDGFLADPSNLYYSSDSSGLLLSRTKGTLVQVPGDTSGEFEIPAGVTYLASCAFAGSKITQLTIGEHVTHIGSFAFGLCSDLTRITFLGDAPAFGTDSTGTADAFQGVTATVWYPANNDSWTEEVRAQYGGTLTWITEKEAEEIASGWSGYTQWILTDDGVIKFSGKGAMKNYTYKSEMPWYSYADQIKTVVIEEGVTSIGAYAFYGMDVESVEIASTVTAIGDYAFKNAEKLDHVVLPEGLTSLGDSAFYACTSLPSIEIPASLWTIKPYTFKNCTALSEVVFNEGNLQKISDGAFYGTALAELVLPDCLDILDVYSFKNCTSLESITIGSCITEIREAVFYGTAIPTITVPEGITKIGPYAFKNCVKLETIELPESLTSVGEASFYACTALSAVELPDAVTAIGNYAFRKCAAIETVTFGSELVSIGECSFYGCTGLTELVIPDSVTTIKPYSFKTCTGLTSVTLGGSVATIGEGAFNTCTGLKAIVFPASVTSIGDYCFSGSTSLWKLNFQGDAPAIGIGAFKGLTANAYYPSGNSTYTTANMLNYGGKLTWTAQ